MRFCAPESSIQDHERAAQPTEEISGVSKIRSLRMPLGVDRIASADLVAQGGKKGRGNPCLATVRQHVSKGGCKDSRTAAVFAQSLQSWSNPVVSLMLHVSVATERHGCATSPFVSVFSSQNKSSV